MNFRINIDVAESITFCLGEFINYFRLSYSGALDRYFLMKFL